MQKNSILKRQSEHLLSSQVADELVMLDTKTGDYLGLNQVAADIWNHLKEPITLEELCAKLMDDYDIDEETCVTETVELLKELQKKNLITVGS